MENLNLDDQITALEALSNSDLLFVIERALESPRRTWVDAVDEHGRPMVPITIAYVRMLVNS